ncbi:MAG: DUF6526 family protein [Crocinitomicaceae bacterium]|jgi:hypothetical protein|nr:DUF6526 family protein [Crocinitomicaceae bacterium]MDP4865438.1 DUF6526 family protein [Crocinitomicaceae bacterium]MDP5010400.1 DUF6526 family protein [Crocinitomicaceae bacterium]
MQNYKNHSRLNPVHHFILTPITAVIFVWSIINVFQDDQSLAHKIYFTLTAVILLILGLLARSYGLRNQDRIIRVEMRLRYFELTGTSFSSKEKQLRLGQIIALRFASDEELIGLMDRAIIENLSGTAIKKAIQNWQGDTLRV